ncbi:TldD/PmbA family protein [Infirmifilum lucidum]|uniref:TldD/PmbA family protein n=1 Tax=Infirmifilum lucidum TaxID=2776706 RepID=A0A7L9FFK7_9CREN|nr:TldD/PmbA family protein [Infirmifilum lucidum]QOJ78570.1 TldD/PmbA family protein [Infirmifilum lucidum]
MSEPTYLLDRGLKRALELGASEAEIGITYTESRTVKSEGPYPKILSRFASDVWVRVAVGKRVAIATATSFDWDTLERTIYSAVEIARRAEEDPHWEGLPDPRPATHGWMGYDEGVASLELEQLAGLVKDLIEEAKSIDPRVKVGAAGGFSSIYRVYTYNTRGVKAEDKGTSMGLFLWLKSSDGGREGTGGASIEARSMIYDTTPLIERAKRLALDSLKAEKLGQVITGNSLFRAEPLASLIEYLVVPALNAMNVLEGFSPLRGRIGEKVLGELTVIDDGSMPGGLATSLYDAEGVPRQRTLLVEKGVLKSYLHNSYTARRMGVPSTGNASRGRGIVGVSSSNLVIKGGVRKEEDLIEDASIVVDGSLLSVHTVNYITGNFSVVASNPYLVKSGELIPVRPVTVSGNLYSIASTLEPAVHVKNTFSGIYTPDILFRGVTVSG